MTDEAPKFPPSPGELEKLRAELAELRADLAAEKKKGGDNAATVAELKAQLAELLETRRQLTQKIKDGGLFDIFGGT